MKKNVPNRLCQETRETETQAAAVGMEAAVSSSSSSYSQCSEQEKLPEAAATLST